MTTPTANETLTKVIDALYITAPKNNATLQECVKACESVNPGWQTISADDLRVSQALQVAESAPWSLFRALRALTCDFSAKGVEVDKVGLQSDAKITPDDVSRYVQLSGAALAALEAAWTRFAGSQDGKGEVEPSGLGWEIPVDTSVAYSLLVEQSSMKLRWDTHRLQDFISTFNASASSQGVPSLPEYNPDLSSLETHEGKIRLVIKNNKQMAILSDEMKDLDTEQWYQTWRRSPSAAQTITE